MVPEPPSRSQALASYGSFFDPMNRFAHIQVSLVRGGGRSGGGGVGSGGGGDGWGGGGDGHPLQIGHPLQSPPAPIPKVQVNLPGGRGDG